VLDLGGIGPLEPAAAVATRLGVDLGPHRSRVLRRGCLAATDLVVGFEQQHTTAAVEVGGAASEHVFLLLELPPLLEALTRLQPSAAGDTRSVVEELHHLRMSAGPRRVAFVPDPLGEPQQVFAETARVIDAVTGALAKALLPGRGVVSA
jgi:protein-tyrosine-phosphatase